MNKKIINEFYNEEGFNVLDFNSHSILERHGVLSGEKSCTKFISHILDLMDVLYLNQVGRADIVIHTNPNSPDYLECKRQHIVDYSNGPWDLPKWADWQLILHYGGQNPKQGEAGTIAMDYSMHLFTRTPGEYQRPKYFSILLHEMKHYYDKKLEFERTQTNDVNTVQEINLLAKDIDEMEEGNDKNLANFFQGFFYMTSEDELSAWMENSRFDGVMSSMLPQMDKNYNIYKAFKVICKTILAWKDDPTIVTKISKMMPLGDIKTYDEFKKFMMDKFGKYMSLRFKKDLSFERYMKKYIIILDKHYKKHMKIWADAYQGEDLDIDPKEMKDILIQKREERLERIRKKKEAQKE